MSELNPQGVRLFYSYSHRDEELRDKLDKHLSLLQRQRLIEAWHDRRINPGSRWQSVISGELANADIILLLVSADFISSDYCFDLEMKTALEMHEANDATVIPIILRPVDWSSAPFAALQALPKDGQAVTSWKNRDEAFADIAKGIRDAIAERQTQGLFHPPTTEPDANEQFSAPQQFSIRTPSKFVRLPKSLNPESVLTFVSNLTGRLGIQLRAIEFSEDFPLIELDLHTVSFRGTDKPIPAVLLWKENQDVKGILSELSRRAVSFGLVMCLSPNLFEIANAQKLRKCCLVSPADLKRLVSSDNPARLLMDLVIEQVGIRRLSPYNILLPVGLNMFFGRNLELERLVKDQGASYAIVGPSRIGKTSLIKQYVRITLRERWQDSGRRFLVNLSECGESADAALRFIAMAIEASSRSNRMTTNQFLTFLHYFTKKVGGPVELILDEADALCYSPALDVLGNAAKEGLIRLIVAGTHTLGRLAMDPNSRLSRGLNVLRPGRLSRDDAIGMLVKPIEDLRLTYEDRSCVEHICNMTGMLPVLLQYYGQALVVTADENGSSVITLDMIKEIERRFEFVHFLMRPILESLGSPLRRIVLELLKSHQSSFTVSDVSEIATRVGEPLDPVTVFELCNALWLDGVLLYEDYKFSLANPKLLELASNLGYLEKGFS